MGERSSAGDDRDPERAPDRDPVLETAVSEGVVEIARPGTTWLSTGWQGGRVEAEAVHSVSVPDGWEWTAIDNYVDRRLDRAGFQRDGPVLLTGVAATHARGARCGSVAAVATAGVSNPAALPTDPTGPPRGPDPASVADPRGEGSSDRDSPGTVNVVVATARDLAPGALANLVAVAAEAKAATLLATVGVPGTTTDAVVVGTDPAGPPAEYSGTGTAVGVAARTCVREAVRASLESRYPDGPPEPSDAEHANATEARASVFDPAGGDDADDRGDTPGQCPEPTETDRKP
jgi:adenosylcobinamide hydrolase